MDKAMKYRIKNEQLAKLVYSVFDKADVQRQIIEQIDNKWDTVKLTSTDYDKTEFFKTKMKPEYEGLDDLYGSVSIYIEKDVIEKTPEYKPDKWNLYPEIKPPKEGRYLIQWKSGNVPYFSIGVWDEKNPWRGNFVFRALPDPYEGEDLKEEFRDWDPW